MTEEHPEIPCGRCDTGTYCNAVIFNPISQAIALGSDLPRCKRYDRICVGAQDFKSAFEGATEQQKAAIIRGEMTEL